LKTAFCIILIYLISSQLYNNSNNNNGNNFVALLKQVQIYSYNKRSL